MKSEPTIFIVEDEKDLASTLAYNLKKEGYQTQVVHNGRDAIFRLTEAPAPDMVLLDLMLPDVSGIEICKRMRQNSMTADVPVLMLTAKGEEIDRVVGFEVGADDYMVKPFSVRELLLRIKAILRRRGAAAESVRTEGETAFGVLRIDSGAHRVWVDDSEVLLTALEFRLLSTFVARKGRVQTREMLLVDVWEMDAGVSTRTVDTHVKRLREKLEAAGAYVETVRGVGYRFKSEPE